MATSFFLPIDVESERGYTFSVTASTRYRIESEPSPDTYYYLSKFYQVKGHFDFEFFAYFFAAYETIWPHPCFL